MKDKQTQAFTELRAKIKEVNGDWTPDFSYGNTEYKYYPAFYYDKEGVFSFYYVLDWSSHLTIPAPFYFKSSEDCEKFARENLELYEQYYVI